MSSVTTEKHWAIATVVVDERVRGLCCRPYPNHPKGCPNFGNRPTCPPRAPHFAEWYSSATGPAYAIWARFALGEHVNRMREKHPDWTERQLACCLYWQGAARKVLRQVIEQFSQEHPAYAVTTCPEAMGVNVTATMFGLGLSLEWPPKQFAYQVAIAAEVEVWRN